MLPNVDSQIAAFLQRVPYAPNVEAPNEPQVIFRGALELTLEQEQFLVTSCLRWKETLEGVYGHDKLAGEDCGDDISPTDSALQDTDGMDWMQRRALWEKVYHQRFGWRRTSLGGIYEDGQNLHFPLTRRVVQQMISRAQNYFFQTEPWSAATPVGLSDLDLSKAANEWAQYRFAVAGLKGVFEKAIELAFIRGECVIASEFHERLDYYETLANVAVGPDRQPIRAADGDFIFDTDTFFIDPTGQTILERDGKTVVGTLQDGGEPVFVSAKIPRVETRFKGPRARIVGLRDFMASFDGDTLQDVKCCIELQEIEAIQIAQDYVNRMEKAGEWNPEDYPRVTDLLRNAQSGYGISSAGKPRPELGEAPLAEGRTEPKINAGIFCLHIDANSDGRLENVYVVIDLDTMRPILYDYVANVFHDKKRPYHAVRVNPLDGRWDGISAIDVFWQMQRFCDLTVNRWDFSNSQSGGVTFWDPSRTMEGAANPHLKLNCGTTYRKTDPNLPADRIVERVQLHDFKGAQFETILQYFMQMFVNMSGVANANDAQAAGLNSAQLATGIRNIDRSGQEQFAPLLSQLQPGIEAVTESCLVIAVRTMDDIEAYSVLGPDGVAQVQTLQSADVRALRWRVQMELTRYRAEQELQQSGQALATVKDYYIQPPQLQAVLAPFYRQQLKAFGVRNVDAVILLPSQDQIAATQAAAGQPSPTGSTPSLTATP